MTPLAAWLLLAGGILMLGLGASWLVDGASRLALRLGVSPMVVGLTIVGFGTSMPELSVSVLAALRGSAGLSLGNAVGSNVMNLLLVLGAAAMLRPIRVVGGQRSMRRDLAFGLVPAVVLMPAAWHGAIGRPAAAALLLVFVVFITLCLAQARRDSHGASERTVVSGHPARHLALAAVGTVVLVVGAELLVSGGVVVARGFGVGEAVIGLTLVAFGTSLPELATSVVAAIKGESELSVGNVLGSNVFNLGMVVGTAFLIRPGTVSTFVIFQDIPILIASTLVVGLIVLRDGRINRWEGALMLSIFTAYLIFIGVRGS